MLLSPLSPHSRLVLGTRINNPFSPNHPDKNSPRATSFSHRSPEEENSNRSQSGSSSPPVNGVSRINLPSRTSSPVKPSPTRTAAGFTSPLPRSMLASSADGTALFEKFKSEIEPQLEAIKKASILPPNQTPKSSPKSPGSTYAVLQVSKREMDEIERDVPISRPVSPILELAAAVQVYMRPWSS